MAGVTKKKTRKRPVSYSSEFCEKALEHFAEGGGTSTLGTYLGVTYMSVCNWRKRHPEFNKAIEEGEHLAERWWMEKGMAGMQGKIPGFNAAVWIFTMKNKFSWRDKKELSGDGKKPITVELVRSIADGKDKKA